MGDTNMAKTDDLVDYNEVDPITETAYNAPNNGKEGFPNLDDCTFDDKQKEQRDWILMATTLSMPMPMQV